MSRGSNAVSSATPVVFYDGCAQPAASPTNLNLTIAIWGLRSPLFILIQMFGDSDVYNLIIMGASFGHENSNELEFSSMPSMTTQSIETNLQRKSSYEEEGNCLTCGILSPKKKKESEVWRADFQSQCQRMKESFKWADTIRKNGVERRSTRVNCMKDFQELKIQFSKKLQNKQVPNSVQMRKLLSVSALLEQTVGEDGGRQSNKSFISKSSFHGAVKVSFAGKSPGKGKKACLMVSILDENMKSLFLPKKAGGMDQQIQSSIYLFVKFTELLQRHAVDRNNAICRMRLSFINQMQEAYGSLTTLTQQQEQELTTSIRQFINLYTNTIEVYYKVQTLTENDKTRFIFSIENVKSVATVILFKNDGFYKFVFNLYESVDRPLEQQIRRIIDLKKSTKPEELEVAPQYCLNQSTINCYLSRASLQRNGLDEVQIPTNVECEPYETCIIKLRQIQEAQTPISKLKVIISTADKISSSINRFYHINNIPFQQMVDSDQILTIFIYIIIHAKIYNLRTHLRFVENFCTEQQLLSETGYYSKVAEGALRMLLEEGEEEFY